jgi:hypothetical protein
MNIHVDPKPSSIGLLFACELAPHSAFHYPSKYEKSYSLHPPDYDMYETVVK